MKLTNKSIYILVTVLISSLLMSFIDGVIQPTYFYKSLFKICLFMIVPFIYFIIYKDEFSTFKQLFIPKKKTLVLSVGLGIAVYIVIIVAYMLFKNFIDFSAIQKSLTSNVGVNADNFLLVAIYISFMNSLLEEFFFRGYAFILLKQKTNPKMDLF